jgi:hypothetical protein
MKRIHILFIALFAAGMLAAQLQHPWEQIYLETGLNPDNAQNGYNYIEVAPDNTLYLLENEAVSGTFGGTWTLRLKAYDGNTWNKVGQDLERNVQNNEAHVDFLVTPTGEIYVGMKDSILHYNNTTQLWESFYVPNFYGGLASDNNGNLYFIHRVDGTSGIVYSDLHIARFDNGTVTLLNPLGIDLPMIPRVVNGSNKICFVGSEIAVSVVAQSVNTLWVFRGNLNTGFQQLEPGASGATLYAGLGLSSMAMSNQGDVIISRKSSSGNLLLIDQYDDLSGTWAPFDTAGLHIVSGHFSQLRYDRNGILHLIYSGDNGTGFLFRYAGQGWEHIGPKTFWSHINILTAWKPWITFDTANVLYWSHGLGTSLIPYQVFKHETGIGIQQAPGEQLASVHVYPNPATYYVHLDHLPIGSGVQLLDLTGRALFNKVTTASKTTLSTESLPVGIYLIRISYNESVTVRKLVVNR